MKIEKPTKKLIKQRLEFFDEMTRIVRLRIKQGEPIPTIRMLKQP
jgi:hypothetical protein